MRKMGAIEEASLFSFLNCLQVILAQKEKATIISPISVKSAFAALEIRLRLRSRKKTPSISSVRRPSARLTSVSGFSPSTTPESNDRNLASLCSTW